MIVFHLHDVQTIDASAAQIFFELLETYKVMHKPLPKTPLAKFLPFQSRGVAIYITHLRSGPRDTFERAGIIDLVGEDAIYNDVGSAMMRIEMVERGFYGSGGGSSVNEGVREVRT